MVDAIYKFKLFNNGRIYATSMRGSMVHDPAGVANKLASLSGLVVQWAETGLAGSCVTWNIAEPVALNEEYAENENVYADTLVKYAKLAVASQKVASRD